MKKARRQSDGSKNAASGDLRRDSIMSMKSSSPVGKAGPSEGKRGKSTPRQTLKRTIRQTSRLTGKTSM
jgi:hypothetical protein